MYVYLFSNKNVYQKNKNAHIYTYQDVYVLLKNHVYDISKTHIRIYYLAVCNSIC